MTRNRNERTNDDPKSTARWFDERKVSKPCGFEPERWDIQRPIALPTA